VDFTGHVDEQTKHEELARAWVHVCPSVKEGWGLVVTEAGSHRVPTVGYRSAGGLRESVLDGLTGLLVDDLDEMTEAIDKLLDDESRRLAMGEAAARHAAGFSWPASICGFAEVLATAVRESMPAVRESVPAVRESAPLAVVEDVDRLVALLDRAVRVERGLHAGDGGDAERGAPAEGDEHGDQGLHSGTRFRGGRRRSVTLEGNVVIHNSAPITKTSQQA
jgi:hypothetical protein